MGEGNGCDRDGWSHPLQLCPRRVCEQKVPGRLSWDSLWLCFPTFQCRRITWDLVKMQILIWQVWGRGRAGFCICYQLLGHRCCGYLDRRWSSKDFGITKQTVEAGRTWEEGKERFGGSRRFSRGRSWTHLADLTLGDYKFFDFVLCWHTGLQQLYPSQGRLRWFARS